MPDINKPIWMDTNYQVSSAQSPYEYSIELKTGNQIEINNVTQDEIITVFNGKAWVRPGDGYINININKVAQNYLYSDLPDLSQISATTSYTQNYAYRKFYLVNNVGATVQTYNFLLDWSYDTTAVTTSNLSHPINGHGTANMLFLSTVFNSSQKVVTTISTTPGSGYDNTHCGDYAIYYLNKYGGWDSFLVEGKVTRTDNYNKLNISRSYNNTTLEFNKLTYNNDITQTYQIVTGWLTDSQSAVLADNLLPSTKMYLHDIVGGKFYPVLCTDQNGVFKTYKNQGRKLVSYTINLECSQAKQRIG